MRLYRSAPRAIGGSVALATWRLGFSFWRGGSPPASGRLLWTLPEMIAHGVGAMAESDACMGSGYGDGDDLREARRFLMIAIAYSAASVRGLPALGETKCGC